jgi:hypothetical protein
MQEPDVSLEKTTVANKRIKKTLPIVLLTRVSLVNWIMRVYRGSIFIILSSRSRVPGGKGLCPDIPAMTIAL